jgi:hypothetical protein
MTHMEVIALAPDSMTHLRAIQGGVVTINGDMKNPLIVGGAQTTG